MRCTRATYLLQLYIDHQLNLQQTRLLEIHLASCPTCRAELFLLEEVTSNLNTLKFVPEPADMHEQIMHKVALTTVQIQLQQRKRPVPFLLWQKKRRSLSDRASNSTAAALARSTRSYSPDRSRKTAPLSLLRPSLAEILVAIVLATIATLAILLQQPSLRAMLPIANGHDVLSRFYMQAVHMLTSIDTNTLILALWIVGTILGVCITLAVAGNEMRAQWFKAMLERLPVR